MYAFSMIKPGKGHQINEKDRRRSALLLVVKSSEFKVKREFVNDRKCVKVI